jgi:hypothetical protein
MEDEESGGSDFNSSDGGSGSWSPKDQSACAQQGRSAFPSFKILVQW